jgi:hypothetical protein
LRELRKEKEKKGLTWLVKIFAELLQTP